MNEYQFDKTPRNGNMVKKRLDGKGDAWADVHRIALPKDYFLQDVDALFGAILFGHNTGERLFLEYVPDDYRTNRAKAVRNFAIVAMFDRKASLRAAFDNHSLLSRALYLYICRTLAAGQARSPRFFYVVGTNSPPWHMRELDIETGDICGRLTSIVSKDTEHWSAVWNHLGLKKLRMELKSSLL